MNHPNDFNPELDLVLERYIEVRPELVWKAWTTPELLQRWFCPAPWTVARVAIDVRPGGNCLTVMRSPEGEEFPNEGCYLEVVPGRRLVFTDALVGGYRPTGKGFMTASIDMIAEGTGTRYRAVAMHASPEARTQHEQMGFHQGWGAALDQLVALCGGLGAK